MRRMRTLPGGPSLLAMRGGGGLADRVRTPGGARDSGWKVRRIVKRGCSEAGSLRGCAGRGVSFFGFGAEERD